MTDKESIKMWLTRYQIARRELLRLQAERKELESYGLHAVRYDVPIGGKGRKDISDTMTIYESLQKKLIQQRYRAISEMNEVKAVIDQIELQEQRQVLTLRYISGLSWESIAQQMYFTERYVHRIHNDALERAAEIIGEAAV